MIENSAGQHRAGAGPAGPWPFPDERLDRARRDPAAGPPGRGMRASSASAVDGTETALAAADHVFGNDRAEITLLEYGDYECPACIQAEPLMRHLVESHPGRVRLVYRHFPLMEVHPHAELAAEAAEAAAAQGKFWPMHQLLFSQPHHLGLEALTGYAQAIGLNLVRFKAEMADHLYTQRVQEHRRAGERSKLRATPAIFLNGRPIDVSFGFEKLEEAVEAGLKRG